MIHGSGFLFWAILYYCILAGVHKTVLKLAIDVAVKLIHILCSGAPTSSYGLKSP